MVHVHVQFDHLIGVERFDAAARRHAYRIADKIECVVILQEGGILREDDALIRRVAVGFQGHHSVAPRAAKQFIHHLQCFEIALLAECRAAKNARDASANFGEDVQRVGDQHRADGRSQNDDQLGGLDEHRKRTLLHQVAGDHGAEYDDNSYNREHRNRASGEETFQAETWTWLPPDAML